MKKADSTVRNVVRNISITATPERVWQVLTRSEEIPAWFCDGATFEAKVNGNVEWRWATCSETPYVGKATVAEYVPNTKLVLKAADQSCWPQSTLSFALKGEGNITVLALTHDGFKPDANVDEVVSRWAVKLEALRYYAETGRVYPLNDNYTWTPENMNARVASTKAGLLFGSMDFIGKKFGEKAVDEYKASLVKSHASFYKGMGLESPLHYANVLAAELKNLYGDKVEVWGNTNKAILERHSHAVFEQASKVGLISDYASFCKMCADFNLAIAKEIGFHGEAVVTTDGYRLTFTK